MAKENKKEISFVEGPIFQSLIRFALPVLGALILQAAYGCGRPSRGRLVRRWRRVFPLSEPEATSCRW